MKRRFQTLTVTVCLFLTLFGITVFSACASPCEHDWIEKSVITPVGCTTDGQKQLECSKCQETKTESISATGHTGGEATCREKATCTVCGNKYGELNASNHTGEAEWAKTADKHIKKYTCCNATVVAEENHEFTNGVCSECEYACHHTGGTATCTDKAICENCDTGYGELNESNHTGEAEWAKTADKHVKKYTCCDAVAVAEENHEWADGVCSECEYVCAHTGGTATCTDKATCNVCGNKYGELNESNHTGEAEWTKTDDKHVKKYTCCNATVIAEENHEWAEGVCSECTYACTHTGGSADCKNKAVCEICGLSYGELDLAAHKGGTATCTDKATCNVCGNKYGELNDSNHMGEAAWTQTADKHVKKYTCCDAVVVAEENHEWVKGVCSECEYACQHTGGNANCKDKAVCEICGLSYGKLDFTTHTGGEATCTERAICSICERRYGDLDFDNHTEEPTWIMTETKHYSIYNCCNTDATTEADHSFLDGICTECGYEFVIDFEGDIVIGSEYYTGENVANINNSLNILRVNEDNSFTIYYVNVGGSGTIIYAEATGTAEYNSETGIYTLTYMNRIKEYGRLKDSLFEFCNEDGSPIDTVNKREGDGVTDVAITVRRGNTDYGYLDLAKNKNGKAMQTLYRDLLKIYEDFYGSNTDIAEKDGEYVLSTVNLNRYGISAEEAISVWKIFGLENPAYYYFRNTAHISDGKLILSVEGDYALASERAKYEADILDMIEECGALLSSNMSELHKVMAIHDYIIKKINYAYEDDGVTPEDAAWAHSIIGVSTVEEGVCEAYAKSFQLLCRYYGIEAITLSGYGGEPHAWNLARIEGKWYCFDLTWNDTGDNGKLSYDCFGLCYSNMNASRTHDMPKSFGLDYLYDIPAVSSMDIQLCTLYKNGESLGFCLSIDHAFSLMDDRDGEYEIVLFDYSYTGPLLLSNAMIKHYICTDNTPDVKKISISGSYKQSDSGYVTLTGLYCLNTNGLTVDTDFSIENMEFLTVCTSFPGIYLDDAKLILSGSNCESEVPFIGKLSENNTESEILLDAYIATIYSKVDVNRITCSEEALEQQANLYLRDTSYADYVSGPSLQVNTYGETVTIGEYRAVGAYPQIVLTNSKLVLGDISASDGAGRLVLSIIFGSLEEVSDIKITGEVDSSYPIVVRIDGRIKYQTTDKNGNVLDEWVEEADPLDIEEPFLHLNENVGFDNISFRFVKRTDNGGYDVDMTYAYVIDSEYNVVLRDNVEIQE